MIGQEIKAFMFIHNRNHIHKGAVNMRLHRKVRGMCAILILSLFPVESLGEFQVTTAWGLQKFPVIYGDIVVWTFIEPGSKRFDIYGYDLSTEEVFQITGGPNNQYAPAIYKNMVVWGDNRNFDADIYGCNLQLIREIGPAGSLSKKEEPPSSPELPPDTPEPTFPISSLSGISIISILVLSMVYYLVSRKRL
jgi:beta propeller repeat protein